MDFQIKRNFMDEALGVNIVMIEQLTNQGIQLVEDSATHNLEIGFRCRYLNALDTVLAQADTSNLSARLLLGRLAIDKVIPQWNLLTQKDETALRCLELVDKRTELQPDVANRVLERFWSHCDNLLWEIDGDTSPIMVGFGAVQLAREAVFGAFSCVNVSDKSTDSDVEPTLNDASFFASVAFAGGAPWENEGNRTKRLEFWTWWLNEALSIAGRYTEAR